MLLSGQTFQHIQNEERILGAVVPGEAYLLAEHVSEQADDA